MQILQNVLLPREEICNCTEMYYHETDCARIYDGYFNIFSCTKWFRYTTIRHVMLKLTGQGTFILRICCEKGVISEETIGLSEKPVFIPIPDLEQQNYLWFELERRDSTLSYPEVCFVTDQRAEREIRLAADICTFRREEYVQRNLLSLHHHILGNQENPLHDKLDVFVIDNGKTLERDELPDREHYFLFPNINAGGSGGFTRGMLEVLSRRVRKGYTHIILMDDDAVLEPDSFQRCFALLSYMKEEYRDFCVAGAMLDLEDRYIQNEAGAFYRDGKPVPARAGVDLRAREEVLENEKEISADYAGWWWTCFPLSVVREDNLPLPFFIHFDDMEYGIRNRNGLLYLNGICVWHACSEKRRPQTNIFYHVRNRMVTDALHLDNAKNQRREELLFCLDEICYNTLRFQYGTADMVLQAVRDFIGGPAKFGKICAETRNDQIRNMTDRFVSFDELSDDPKIRREMHEYADKAVKGQHDRKVVGKLRYLLTLNGWLLPARRRKSELHMFDIFLPDMRELYRAPRAVLIDPYAGKGVLVKKSYRRALHSVWCMIQVTWLMMTRYDKCSDAYRKNWRKLTNKNFWKRYLNIESTPE